MKIRFRRSFHCTSPVCSRYSSRLEYAVVRTKMFSLAGVHVNSRIGLVFEMMHCSGRNTDKVISGRRRTLLLPLTHPTITNRHYMSLHIVHRPSFARSSLALFLILCTHAFLTRITSAAALLNSPLSAQFTGTPAHCFHHCIYTVIKHNLNHSAGDHAKAL